MRSWEWSSCAVLALCATAALGDPFDNEQWYRGAPPAHRAAFIQQMWETSGLKDQVPPAKTDPAGQLQDLQAFGNPAPVGAFGNQPRDIHGRYILAGPLSSSDGMLNAAGDAMGVSVITKDGVLPMDAGQPTRLASEMQQREYGKGKQPVQMIISERDMKVMQAIALFTADINDQPQIVRGKLTGLSREESETGGLSRLVATIRVDAQKKYEVVLNSQKDLDAQQIQLGDSVVTETDVREVDGKQMLFAVGLKKAPAIPATAAAK